MNKIAFVTLLFTASIVCGMDYKWNRNATAVQRLQQLTTQFERGEMPAQDVLMDLNSIDSAGYTTLIHAVSHNYPISFIEFLIQHKADVNQPDAKGNTPVMHAANANHRALTFFLISNGADIWQMNKNGKNALDVVVGH